LKQLANLYPDRLTYYHEGIPSSFKWWIVFVPTYDFISGHQAEEGEAKIQQEVNRVASYYKASPAQPAESALRNAPVRVTRFCIYLIYAIFCQAKRSFAKTGSGQRKGSF
jgi:hypothetical protein